VKQLYVAVHAVRIFNVYLSCTAAHHGANTVQDFNLVKYQGRRVQ